MYHGNLNLFQPISFNSVSSTSVFTVAGLIVNGPYEVDSLSRLTSLVHYSMVMG